VNTHYNSSWALFSADDEVAPEVADTLDNPVSQAYAYSGYNYTFEHVDQKKLDQVRTWTKKHFSSHQVIVEDMYTSLNDAEKEEGDFNVLGKVT
jgi:hypothetical protein